MGKVYGYIRVSSADQNEDRQLIALRGCQIPERNLYIDKQSGKDFERPNTRVWYADSGATISYTSRA